MVNCQAEKRPNRILEHCKALKQLIAVVRQCDQSKACVDSLTTSSGGSLRWLATIFRFS
jgi:hypothetical protein